MRLQCSQYGPGCPTSAARRDAHTGYIALTWLLHHYCTKTCSYKVCNTDMAAISLVLEDMHTRGLQYTPGCYTTAACRYACAGLAEQTRTPHTYWPQPVPSFLFNPLRKVSYGRGGWKGSCINSFNSYTLNASFVMHDFFHILIRISSRGNNIYSGKIR